MNPVDKVKKLSKSDFISTFGNVFEKTTWIAEKVFNFKPFGNFETLSEKFLIIFENENEKNCLKIFNAHPELAIKKIMTTDSRKEQSNAKLNQCTEEELKEFIELNKDYKNKFGFPFIIAVKGKNKSEILENFKKRIKNNKNVEFEEAKKQVKKIASLRIEELKKIKQLSEV